MKNKNRTKLYYPIFPCEIFYAPFLMSCGRLRFNNLHQLTRIETIITLTLSLENMVMEM